MQHVSLIILYTVNPIVAALLKTASYHCFHFSIISCKIAYFVLEIYCILQSYMLILLYKSALSMGKQVFLTVPRGERGGGEEYEEHKTRSWSILYWYS